MNKLDKEIKNKLEQREISPSSSAWDKLSLQLENEDKKSHKKYWWIGIAASFLAGIFISSLVFQSAEVENKNKIVIEEPAKVETENASEEVIQQKNDPVLTFEDSAEEDDVKEELPKQYSEVEKLPAKVKQSHEAKSAIKSSQLVVQEVEHPESILSSESAEEQHFQEVNKNTLVTDAEIDRLLEEAQSKVRLRQFTNPYNRVSAQALLESVEVEDSHTFKEKILLALEGGFHHVKSAVVDKDL